MNERIRELAEQAEKYAYESFDGNIDRNTERFKTKFAELIIRECAEIAKKEQAFNERYTDAKMHPQVNIDQCILMGFGL